jgi:hypothetical protein
VLLCLCAAIPATSAEKPKVTLILKNGDRLTGELLSEDAERVVISTPWNVAVFVPKSSIEQREEESVAAAPPKGEASQVVAGSSAQTEPKPAPPPPKPKPAAVAKKSSPWKWDVRLGANFVSGAKDQELYFAQGSMTYLRNYKRSPKHFFRNTLDYRVDYGTTDSRVTANRMSLTEKMDADVWGPFYGSLWVLAGYDEIRKIDSQYEVGPSIGYHILALKSFVLNAETGINWQARRLTQGPDREIFQGRLRQDLTWEIVPKITLTERFEFLPFLEELGEYQVRAEGNVGFGIVRSLSLNLTLLNLYDTQPAPDVPNNELQFRTSLGVKF